MPGTWSSASLSVLLSGSGSPLDHASESPGEPAEWDGWFLIQQVCGEEHMNMNMHKFQGDADADAAGLENTFEDHCCR